MRYTGQLFCDDDASFTISRLGLTIAEAFLVLQGTGSYDGAAFEVEARLARARYNEFHTARVRYPSDGWEPSVALRILTLSEAPDHEFCELQLEWLENRETWLLEGELAQAVS